MNAKGFLRCMSSVSIDISVALKTCSGMRERVKGAMPKQTLNS